MDWDGGNSKENLKKRRQCAVFRGSEGFSKRPLVWDKKRRFVGINQLFRYKKERV